MQLRLHEALLFVRLEELERRLEAGDPCLDHLLISVCDSIEELLQWEKHKTR